MSQPKIVRCERWCQNNYLPLFMRHLVAILVWKFFRYKQPKLQAYRRRFVIGASSQRFHIGLRTFCVIEVPHLYVALSGHGFGHLAQTAPVLNAFRQRHAAIRLTVQSPLPEPVLRGRIVGEFAVVAGAADFGMVMVDALDVKLADSLAAYRAFHGEWEARLDWQESVLRRAAPDLLLADIPYLSLAAAARLAIPALALCSLNWADILQGYGADAPDLAALRARC